MPRLKSEFCFIYVTCVSLKEAKKISRAVIEAKLAACANILPQMISVYEWQGETQSSTETLLLLKTRKRLAQKAKQLVQSLHSYEVPCLLEIDFKANPIYGRWLRQQSNPD